MNASFSSTPDLVGALDTLIHDTVATVLADPVLGSVFDGTASRDTYLRFLTQTYHYVLETTPLLRAGARAFAASSDAFGKSMHERFAEHAREETGHEQWLLDDIEALGADVEAAKRAEPSPAVQAYVAMVRFTGRSRRPIGLMGVGFLLEGVSEKLGTQTADNLRARSKIPGIEKALSFVDSHGSTDVGHMEEGRKALRTIEDPNDRAAVLLCAQCTALYYTELLG